MFPVLHALPHEDSNSQQVIYLKLLVWFVSSLTNEQSNTKKTKGLSRIVYIFHLGPGLSIHVSHREKRISPVCVSVCPLSRLNRWTHGQEISHGCLPRPYLGKVGQPRSYIGQRSRSPGQKM